MTDRPTLVTLAELVAEGFGAFVHSGPNIDALANQLGDDVVLDDIGRRCVKRDTARRLFAERAEQQERARAQRAQHAEAQTYGDALRRAPAARAQHQRELLREHPNLSAAELMALTSGDPDDRLDAAGRRTASRRGVIGYLHRFNNAPQRG